MNKYTKYAPNVFVAACEQEHQKGDTIHMATKYGDGHEAVVYNSLGKNRNGLNLYSVIRADGFDYKEHCKQKAERRSQWAESAAKKSEELWQASKEGSEFLALAEPIKIGHHSEGRHRALIDRNHKRMGKSIEQDKKAAQHLSKAEYWESKAEQINLSMPESVEYYEHKLEQAQAHHAGLKSGTIPKAHSYSLTYAKKTVNELSKKYEMAQKLWGE